MIGTVVRVGLLRMWHGRVEMLLTFVVPIAFFTVFAFIFDNQIGIGSSPYVDVALVDEDDTELSRTFVASLAAEENVRPVDEPRPASADEARGLVLRGQLPAALVVPEGWSASVTDGERTPLDVAIYADSSDPVSTQILSALVPRVAGQLLAERARTRIQALLMLDQASRSDDEPPAGSVLDVPGLWQRQLAASADASFPRPVSVDVVDLFGAGKANPVVSMYAAGIAVMFLLFGAVGGAGSLLEEEESQTLERLMCSRLGMTELLLGKWLLLTFVGVVQVTVMFVWAQLVFGVDLLGHLPGFALMTVVTAGASSSLALTLAALCRSRVQLNAVAIILILCMSALGGSMVPRYIMSESMREFGRITFNAWALDGYMKIFWRDLPLRELTGEVTVLVTVAAVLLVAARVLARRWESA